MKFDRIPTRRKPVPKTLYARLFNQTKPKRQRAAAAAHSNDDDGDSGINISRSLTIIFAIHIVAIGMIFIHKQYLSGRTTLPESMVAATSATEAAPSQSRVTSVAPVRSDNYPKLSSGDETYMVVAGDNYPIIAAKKQVDESALRNHNRGADIRPGAVLRIPQSRRIIAEVPPELAALRNRTSPGDSERGLVELLPPLDDVAATAQLITPSRQQTQDPPRAIPVSASGRSHTVKSGENIWRISNQYKVDQKALMSLNNISDPTKLKIGQTLKLP